MKGQINFEFLASAAFYLLAVGAVMLNASSFIPDYRENLQSASKHTEARAVTSSMLTEPGSHNHGSGGSEWEKNANTQSSITGVGVASGFHRLDEDKIRNLTTAGGSGLNYTEFRAVSGVENQYRFRFVWMPVIETPREFRKDNPPSSPPINTPSSSNFSSAGNSVHYGNETINGEDIRVLVTSHDGVYDHVYFSGDGDWNFEDSDTGLRVVGGEVTQVPDQGFALSEIQNRVDDRGAAVFLSARLKSFGASPDTASSVVRMDRYAELEGEPVRIEVLVW
jgi:hypothetical protein